MPTPDEKRLATLAGIVDGFLALDLTGLGVVGPLQKALARRQPGPLGRGAARFILAALDRRPGPALIATGFPMGGGLPETDGPVGAAMLARALLLGCGRTSVLVADEPWQAVLAAACRGAGLTPLPLAPGGAAPVPYLKPVYLASLPREPEAGRRAGERLLAGLAPSLLVAVERPGRNAQGACHGLNGRSLAGWVADVDGLFARGREAGLPLLGVGDGGNELGMGLLAEELRELLPQARDCGCGCGGGVVPALAADYLVVASVSNWGVSGMVAALALDLGRPDLLPDSAREARSIESCAAAGGLDGASVSPEPAVDGIPAAEWAGLVGSLRAACRRGLGLGDDWRRG